MGDLVVSSAGSVGLDETLDLQVSVPIPDKWTQGKPLLAGLKGEVIPFRWAALSIARSSMVRLW